MYLQCNKKNLLSELIDLVTCINKTTISEKCDIFILAARLHDMGACVFALFTTWWQPTVTTYAWLFMPNQCSQGDMQCTYIYYCTDMYSSKI